MLGLSLRCRVDRVNNFDFLRYFAAACVVFGHACVLTTGDRETDPLYKATLGATDFGMIGVSIFFLMSGWLISMSWERTPRLVRFAWARALRIYPAFIVMLLVVYAALSLVTTRPDAYLQLSTLGRWLENVRLYQWNHTLPGVFEHGYTATVNGSIWTLGWEVMCYGLVALFGVTGLLTRRVVTVVTVLALTLYTFEPVLRDAIFVRLATYFLVGSTLYFHRTRVPWTRVLALVAAAALLLSWTVAPPHLKHATMAVSLGYLVFYMARGQWASRWAQWGDASYGLYIYAWPINQVLLLAHPDWSVPTVFAATLTLATLAGFASWHLIERPALRLKDWRSAGLTRVWEEIASGFDRVARRSPRPD